ncbi:MAG: extracellular solute-binding protein [Eubacterium sp.]|nr:extracellular solute-binding protein [Eubacterium sp.]
MKKHSFGALLLAIIMCISLVGCGGNGNTSADSSVVANSGTQSGKDLGDAGKILQEAKTTPFGKYPETVYYTMAKQTTAEARMAEGDTYENNGYTRYLLDKLNIQNKNEFEANTEDAYNQKIALAIASGDIPDIMIVNDLATLDQLVENDLIQDLSQVYENCVSDKIKDIYNSYDGRSLKMVTYDGKIMALPGTQIENSNKLLWLRKDWMDKLGLKEPKTLQDLEHILTEFVTKDPGGNGAGKTVGLVALPDVAGNYGGGYMLDPLFASFFAYPKQWMKNASGEIYYGSVANEVKPALGVLKNWYKKGLIDPQFIVREYDDVTSLIVNGTAGAAFAPWWMPRGDSYDLNKDVEWAPYICPLDKSGELTYYSQNPCRRFIVVRKGYEYPEVAAKSVSLIFDYNRYIDDVNNELTAYETKTGVHQMANPLSINLDYNDAVNISHENLQAALNGEKDPKTLMSFEYGLYQTCSAYLENPKSATGEQWKTYMARVFGASAANDKRLKAIDPVYFGTTESMPLKWANLEKLEEEALLKIIVGDKPLEYFDEFVKNWYSQGGADITKEVKAEVEMK